MLSELKTETTNVNDNRYSRAALHNTQYAKEVTRRRRRVTTTVSSNDGVAAAVSLPRQRCSDRQLAKAVASTRAAAQANPAGRDLTLDFLAGSETEVTAAPESNFHRLSTVSDR